MHLLLLSTAQKAIILAMYVSAASCEDHKKKFITEAKGLYEIECIHIVAKTM